MASKFEIKKATNGQYHFNLKAGNGSIILSSELYHVKSNAEHGIEAVKANAANDNRFERRTAKNGEPYFVLKAANGEIIGKSEMYSSIAAMENGIDSVKKNAADARVEDLSLQAKAQSARR